MILWHLTLSSEIPVWQKKKTQKNNTLWSVFVMRVSPLCSLHLNNERPSKINKVPAGPVYWFVYTVAEISVRKYTNLINRATASGPHLPHMDRKKSAHYPPSYYMAIYLLLGIKLVGMDKMLAGGLPPSAGWLIEGFSAKLCARYITQWRYKVCLKHMLQRQTPVYTIAQ